MTKRALTTKESADLAEAYVIERINSRPGWTAVNANIVRNNQPRYDVIATNAAGRELRVSVKSASTGKDKQAYLVDTPHKQYPVAIYAFVDMRGATPGPVYLAGSTTVVSLADERHNKYHDLRGNDPLTQKGFKKKISRVLLEKMGTCDAWRLLDDPTPKSWPRVTAGRRQHARDDAVRPLQTRSVL